jgi:hypothetical protein
LIVIAIIGILIAILLPAVQAAREAARRSHCSNNLKQIGLALQLHHEAYKTLPPGGVMHGPCCSTKSYTNWAIAILPFFEEQSLYSLYDQHAFNEDEVNAPVREAYVKSYFCPSEPGPPELVQRDSGPGATRYWMPGSYRAMTGRASRNNWWGNYFPDSATLPMLFRGPIHTVGNPGPTGRVDVKLGSVRFRQIVDGLSKTIAVGERSIELKGGAISHLNRTAWAYSYGQYNKSAAHLDARMFWREFDACLRSPGPGGEHACKQGWSSFHPGGMHFVHCDGSTYFQTDDIDLELFAAKATIAGGD